MKKRIPVWSAVVLAAALILVTVLITAQVCYGTMFLSAKKSGERTAAELSRKIDALDPDKDLSLPGKFRAIYNYFQKYRIDGGSSSEDDETILKRFLAESGDKYAEYYTAEEYAAMKADNSGAKTGVGIYVSENAAGEMVITHVEEGSPAAEAKLQKKDVISAVDGAKVSEIGVDEAVRRIQGEAGKELRLTILRGAEEHTYSITRAKIAFKTVRQKTLDEGVGYIRILSFSQNTAEEFKKAIDALTESGVRALIFDVRDNSGGSLSSIHKVLDYLIPDGEDPCNVILSTKDALDNVVYYRCGDEHAVSLPMAVLVNGSTASAAELFAAALRDYGMAFTVGSVTYGKGVAQSVVELRDGSAFKMTTGTFDPPKSGNFNGVGVPADVPYDAAGINFNLLDPGEDGCVLAAREALKTQIENH